MLLPIFPVDSSLLRMKLSFGQEKKQNENIILTTIVWRMEIGIMMPSKSQVFRCGPYGRYIHRNDGKNFMENTQLKNLLNFSNELL